MCSRMTAEASEKIRQFEIAIFRGLRGSRRKFGSGYNGRGIHLIAPEISGATN
ncbi:hypothetical protein IE4872_PC00226 (plasmid) [Rhizobium gallicum]|uniref:Uncharacterized protein n=2 Tax=Rhizobium gallicum TaxID=56730 RepID=A0A0B4X6S9_9HYPH|nr:hypothetical protein RGR602_PB00232 [Rhizobium gallicum bv. gallicum R602sp]APO70254.1 hypothetical protein IE4872_PC00226 [Rhizobium gallicum]